MSEYLVRLRNRVPADTSAEALQELRQEERARAGELRAAGLLVRLWRVPGTRDAVALFQAKDATELHEALSSLPTFPWQEILVEELATHPQEA